MCMDLIHKLIVNNAALTDLPSDNADDESLRMGLICCHNSNYYYEYCYFQLFFFAALHYFIMSIILSMRIQFPVVLRLIQTPFSCF